MAETISATVSRARRSRVLVRACCSPRSCAKASEREPPRDAYAALMRARAECCASSPTPKTSAARLLPPAPRGLGPGLRRGARHGRLFSHLQSWSRMSARPLRDNWRARWHLREALKLDAGAASSLAMCSETALIGAHDIDLALALAEAAVSREPDDAHALALLGHIRRMAGEDPRASIALIERAQRLSPRDPRTFLWLLYTVWCHWKLGETGEMEALARRSIALYRQHSMELARTRCGARLAGAARRGARGDRAGQDDDAELHALTLPLGRALYLRLAVSRPRGARLPGAARRAERLPRPPIARGGVA